jgi:rare lipoprotein A
MILRWLLGLALVTAVPTAPLVRTVVVPAQAAAPVPATPVENRLGMASWYGGGERLNKHVAMGHRFDPESLEAAMWDVPLGSKMKITNLENGRTVIVRVTDRGPNRRFGNRIIDLTRGSFAKLAPLRQGLIRVRVEKLS